MAPPHRVVQLDALRLDDEIDSLFLSQSTEFLRHCNISIASVKPEVQLCLRLLSFANTVNSSSPTPGLSLHSLAFSSLRDKAAPLTSLQKLSYLCTNAFLPYIIIRLAEVFPTLSERLQTLTKVVELLNRFHFLSYARFPTLSHRVSGISLVHPVPVAPQRSPFEILHSQLVWQGVAQFALFLSPVIRSLVNRPIRASRRDDACAVCAGNTMLHVMMPCRCLYCYICGVEVRRVCSACGGVAGGLQRLRYD